MVIQGYERGPYIVNRFLWTTRSVPSPFQQKSISLSDNPPAVGAIYPGENRKEKGLKNPPCWGRI